MRRAGSRRSAGLAIALKKLECGIFMPLCLLLALAVVANADDCGVEAACSSNFDGGDQGSFRSTSLLQIASPLRRGAQAFAHQQLAAAAAAAAAADTAAASEGTQLSDESTGTGSQLAQQSAVSGQAGQAFEQEGSQNSETTSTGLQNKVSRSTADALKAAQAAQAIEEAHRDNKAAQAAQHLQSTRSAEVGEALLGAMQRVQRAGEVESQELAMEAVATRRLQDAARGASQVQALEDEGAVREARTAELLQEAMGTFEIQDQEDSIDSSPLRGTMKALQAAQKALAAEAAFKVHASQLLQTSLQGAAVAVEALKRSKEEQTATWLRDAGRGLQWVQGRWAEHTDAETKVGKHLEDASKSTEKAQKLAGSTAANTKYTAALMQDAAQKARTAAQKARSGIEDALQKNKALQQMQEALVNQQIMRNQQMQALQPTNYAPQTSMAQDQAFQNAYFQGLMQGARPGLPQDVSELNQAAPMGPLPSQQNPNLGNTLLQRMLTMRRR